MSKKLSLSDLKLTSFITGDLVKGGLSIEDQSEGFSCIYNCTNNPCTVVQSCTNPIC